MNASSGPPQVAVVRHMAFEDPGLFAEVLAARGFASFTMDAGVDDLAALEEADLAVVLGGPIGVNETERYPFLKQELQLLKKRLAAGRPTLGVCLGAQLIVRALGARVYPGGSKEIGWGSVQLTEAGKDSCLAVLETQPVLHWHGDTFDCPAGAQLLAGTDTYPNQAFSYGRNVLALQFHAEADSRRIEQWLIGHTNELSAAGIDIPALREASRTHGEGLRKTGRRMLSDWLDQIEW
ncbi:glutamine amidotransferase [Thiohalomonas denitrificans]|uniref:glutamine amidotransferase n=1 Tax=Thiohalomonas denitrificans TaxID=415747 RepID=UPI0026E9F430|nr:glutamine amidotransferase [Thiohalomonas denitrificans]